MKLLRTWLPALILLLCWTSARASWVPLFDAQELCAAKCSGLWSHPQFSLDHASVVMAETQGQITSLWKFALGQPQKRVLVYRGAVRLWALDAAPSLLVLKPDNTLISYDMTQKKQRWSVKILEDIASIAPLIPGQVVVLKTAAQLPALRLRNSVSGQPLELEPTFELQTVAQEDNEALPATGLKVREVVSSPGGVYMLRLAETAGGAVRLEGYGYFYECVACGSNR